MTTQILSAELVVSSLAPIGDLLGRASQELAHLGRQLNDLEAVVGPLILEAARADPDVLHRAQGFDHLGQKLSGLAAFLAALAPAASRQWLVDPTLAAQVLTLADLAARLRAPAEPPPKADAEALAEARGDCELF